MIAPALIAFLGAVSIGLMVYSASLWMRSSHERDRFKAKIERNEMPMREPGDVPSVGMKRYIARTVHIVGDRFKPKGEEDVSRVQAMFLKAGLRSRNVVALFFGTKVLFGAAFLVSFVLIKVVIGAHLAVSHMMLFSALSATIGFYLPNLWLSSRIARRQEKILLGFPDALDLMVVSAEAGMGLDAALKRVGEEMRLSNTVLSDEFKIVNLELRAGKSRAGALRSLGTRTGLEDVNELMTLLIQTDKFGTSIAQALRVHADSMRAKRMQKVEEIAAKLPVKLLFPTVLFIFPSLFLVIMGPALIRVLRIWGL